MIVPESSSWYTNMSWRRGKSSGWAAFDNKQRRKDNLEPEVDYDPFPPMSAPKKSLFSRKKLQQNHDLKFRERPFSSVVMQLAAENRDCNEPLHLDDFNSQQEKKNHDNNFVQNIEDIGAAEENDFAKASALLTEKVPTEGETNIAELTTTCLPSEINLLMSVEHGPSEETTDFSHLSLAMEDFPAFNQSVAVDECASFDKMISADDSHLKVKLWELNAIPVEPEWEEDDVYLSHRKEAIKTTREASQHAKAARNAFMGGNHFAAQEFSLKAREKWMAAERLNAKAAKEILNIRNAKYDLWRLDLHGLHAAEAVQAVQERLQMIEFHLSLNRSVSPNRHKESTGIVRSSSMNFLSFMDKEKLNKRRDFPKERQTSLQIITGVGTHSRGQAALPMAIRSFLDANCYRYDEVRPGVISVRPKFRRK